MQTLIDEGRITEAEARVHPHRNLILQAIDGTHDLEPDLFVLELKLGDRLLLCSDGASGVLDAGRLADILSSGSPDYAAVELVRASLEAGSSDNVTCLVADVVEGEPRRRHPGHALCWSARPPTCAPAGPAAPRPAACSAATAPATPASSSRSAPRSPTRSAFAISSDPIADPEAVRYAPRAPGRYTWLSRLLALAVVVGVVWVIGAAAWSWSQDQYYVGEQDGTVVIYRGLDASLPGVDLSQPYETHQRRRSTGSPTSTPAEVREGIDADEPRRRPQHGREPGREDDPADAEAAC